MFQKLKHLYYSYAINELPSDLWLAYRSKQLRAFFKNKLDCTAGMSEFAKKGK